LPDAAVTAARPRAVAAAITRGRARLAREPTWAEALAGIDPEVLVPLTWWRGGRCRPRSGGGTYGPG
jgi:hypothetical protein